MIKDQYLTEKVLDGVKVFCCNVEGSEDVDETCTMDDGYALGWDDCTYATKGGDKTKCEFWIEKFKNGVDDLTTPEGFFALWDAAKDKEWWTDFGETTMSAYEANVLSITRSWMQYIINPLRFRDALYDFLKGRES